MKWLCLGQYVIPWAHSVLHQLSAHPIRVPAKMGKKTCKHNTCSEIGLWKHENLDPRKQMQPKFQPKLQLEY